MRFFVALGVLGLCACSDDTGSPAGGGGDGGGGGAGANGGAGGAIVGGQGGVGGMACVPGIEVCDTLDNDCDEQVDEGFEEGCDVPNADTDEDGLRDLWEVWGVDVDADGTIDVDLPAMGASPLRKNAFLHVDWMEESGANAHSDRFSDEAMWRVQEAFLNAPLDNPDGTTGISLHLDAGPDSIMNPLTMAAWGALSLAKAIPHQDQVNVDGPDCGELLDIKDAHMPLARRGLFRYGMAVHALEPRPKDPPCTTGTTQFNGCGVYDYFGHSQGSSDQLLIQLGGFDPNVQDAVQESAHFMHELGHTFGLRHGGTSDIHRKPNLLSVMNYSYSYRGLFHEGSYGTLDYSRFELPDLNESELDESVGLNAATELEGYGFIRYCGDQNVSCLEDLSTWTGELVEESDATAAIDWNCSGAIDTGLVAAEINATPPLASLPSRNEWTFLDFEAYGRIGGGAQTGASIAESEEPGVDDPMDLVSPLPYRVVVAGQGIRRDKPGRTVLSFALVNRGADADVYDLSFRARGLRVIDAPNTVSLEPGAHRVVSVPVELPATRHGRARLVMRAESHGNLKMAAEAETLIE